MNLILIKKKQYLYINKSRCQVLRIYKKVKKKNFNQNKIIKKLKETIKYMSKIFLQVGMNFS